MEMYTVPCETTPVATPCEQCASFGYCRHTKPTTRLAKGMSLAQAQAALAEANEKRPFGRSWSWLADKQGAPIK